MGVSMVEEECQKEFDEMMTSIRQQRDRLYDL